MTPITPSPDFSPVSAPTSTANGHYLADNFCLTLGTLPEVDSHLLKSSLKSSFKPHDSSNAFEPAFAPTGPAGRTFVKKRPRNMSQSSADKDSRGDGRQSIANGATACNTLDGSGSNAKKRPSTDTIDYPRRRAIIAVRVTGLPYPSPKNLVDSSHSSVRSAVPANLVAMAIDQNVDWYESCSSIQEPFQC